MTSGIATQDRHATWLELYFDLVFVVAIAQLSAAFIHDPTFEGFLRFVGLFLPIWWGWVGFAIYCARFEFDDWLYRVLMFAAMLGVAAMSTTIGSIDSDSAAFAAAYGFVRLDLVLLYLLAWKRVPEARELTARFALGFGIAAAIWFVSIGVPTPGRYWLWGVAMSIGVILTPLLSTQALARTPVSASHVPERFGLFMIIVLGESVLAVVVGTADTEWKLSGVVAAILCFACGATLWWNYFDFASRAAHGRLARSVRSGALARNVYSWGHFPIAIGLTLLGVGSEMAIHDAPKGELGVAARWTLLGGISLYLVAISLIVGLLAKSVRAICWPRMPAAVAIFGLALFAGELPALLVLSVLAGLLVSQILLERAVFEHEAGDERLLSTEATTA